MSKKRRAKAKEVKNCKASTAMKQIWKSIILFLLLNSLFIACNNGSDPPTSSTTTSGAVNIAGTWDTIAIITESNCDGAPVGYQWKDVCEYLQTGNDLVMEVETIVSITPEGKPVSGIIRCTGNIEGNQFTLECPQGNYSKGIIRGSVTANATSMNGTYEQINDPAICCPCSIKYKFTGTKR